MQTWGARGAVAAVGVAVVIAGIGGAAVHAATASGPGFGGPGFGGPGFGGPGHGGPPPDRSGHGAVDAVHGEYVVAAGAGRFVTRVTQVGELTATSPGSVTVRSADGFSAQYVLPPGAPVPAATVGDQVTVQARRDGSATVVQSIAPTGGG